MVNEQGFTLSKASKKLKIKLTTARLIVKKFNELGVFSKRTLKKEVRPPKNTKKDLPVKMEEIGSIESAISGDEELENESLREEKLPK